MHTPLFLQSPSQVEVPLGHVVEERVAITAKRGLTYEGAGAVDDVEFVDCAPPVPPPSGKSLLY